LAKVEAKREWHLFPDTVYVGHFEYISNGNTVVLQR